MCILGIPAILAGVLKIAFNQIKGIKLGVKALLRAQMIADYNKWEERGYAPIYARENFQNLWVQYHAIKGPNGVIDDIHERFLALPTESAKNKKEAS
jgi:hypothetical protein